MADIDYIVFWKTDPGQQVSTIADAHNQPVRRDLTYVQTNDIPILSDEGQVFTALELANGERYAVSPDLARETLGWDL